MPLELVQHPTHCKHLEQSIKFCPLHGVSNPSKRYCGRCPDFTLLPFGSRPKIKKRRTRRRIYLGSFLERLIASVTFNQGQRIAKAIGRLLGRKGCGCGRRKRYLNRWSWRWPLW